MASIGLSKPRFATYSESTQQYDGAKVAGKAVNWNLALNGGSENKLYGDNAPAESDAQFAGGTLAVSTTDIDPDILKVLLGITQTSETIGTATVKVLHYDDRQSVPYIGFAGIRKAMVDGVVYYQAMMLNKVKPQNLNDSYETQGETINWIVPELVMEVFKDDTQYHEWKKESELLDTEAEALAVIEAWMAAPTPGVGQ